jgi:hypothetical protein
VASMYSELNQIFVNVQGLVVGFFEHGNEP